ncbi:MAG: sugar phosphate isomerase/epimerase [Isosphaeraceae bacterium]|nr:sugar phosphate isomerase/epimerase [Isosphaeraceae bacterium]
MRLGVGSYTFVWAVGVPGFPAPDRPLTAEGLLRKASELGVRVVQIADNLPLDDRGATGRAGLRRLAERLGIEIQVGTRGVRPDHLLGYLALAREFRSPVVRVVTDTDDDHPTPDEVVEAIRAVIPAYERAGVALAIENHDRFRGAVLADILKRVGSPLAGICLDTANSIGCLEDLPSLLASIGGQVVNLHVKDYQIRRAPHQKGFIVEGRPAGRGQLDIPWLLAELRSRGRDPDAILELWPPPESRIADSVAKEDAWAAESVRYLRRFIPD